ncbi:MAG: MBL fold metallo-hydrolase [Anaerovoracaceae bacterium]|nr:MBL fold metallo-hydrolase [Bacillota bacterium]MDY2670629.1 MBL fold metallo-hydrolase [Anaerovoracaceae bacterium]
MKIRFCGAADGVTGSCHLIETDKYKFLLDCGMFQGGRRNEERNKVPFPFNPSDIDFVILSHAHVDHCGRLPLLVKQGFRSQIYCTDATVDLADLILRDSAYINQREVEYRNKKNHRLGRKLEEPVYTINDAIEAVKYLTPVFYGQKKEIRDGITVRFSEAGHMLGSSIIELWIDETDKNGHIETTKLVFSGDLGTVGRPILRDPELISEADAVIMETTYGDRLHPTTNSGIEDLSKAVQKTIKRGGTAVIPAFAVGRTQDIVYYFNRLFDEDPDFAKTMKDIKFYVDSPMAESATEVFKKNAQDYDEESRELLLEGKNPLNFKNLVFVKDVFESQALNHDSSPKVIISASGMCEAGRIKHHLKHNLWDSRNSIIFVGYQAEGTLGRSIIDGQKDIKIFGEPIHIAAEIINLRGFSGHADRDGLYKWITSFNPVPEKIFLVHGEQESKKAFAEYLKEKAGINAIAVMGESTTDLSAGEGLKKVRVNEQNAKMDELISMRDKLAQVHHGLEHILYTTTLAADESMTDERINRINEIILNLEKDTLNLGSAVTDMGEPGAYEVGEDQK